jgi:multiple sugar transport system ATP-binding protein
MSRVRLDNVQVAYDGAMVVRGVSFTVEPGELCVLVGPSGSGKSSILRAITGYAPVVAGHVYIGDRLVNQVHPSERDIAMVFQDLALYPHMTVRENWAFPLEAVRLPRAEIAQRIAEVARMLQMEPLLDRLPRQLSGGQQQRVAVGRALVRRPQLFLLDEPLGALDAKLRVEARSAFKKIQQDLGITSIYVTHDQIEAQALGSRIVILNAGEVQQIGTPDEIYDLPANRFVGSLIGSPPMNFIRCTLERTNGELALRHGELRVVLPPATAQRVDASARSAEVLLGVRPEHIHLVDGPRPGAAPASVYVTEPQGHTIIVDLRLNDELIKLRTQREALPHELQPNDRVFIAPDAGRVHVFELETGRRIS